MIRLLPRAGFTKGLWRNGRGISWDIASGDSVPSTDDFGWRFAIAEIAAPSPFSLYGPVDRVFTLIEGEGVDLCFAGGARLAVHERFVPHRFACDIPTECALAAGASKALNLFTARGRYAAEVEIVSITGSRLLQLPVPLTLLFALQGEIEVNGQSLALHDAAKVEGAGQLALRAQHALLYVARLDKLQVTSTG